MVGGTTAALVLTNLTGRRALPTMVDARGPSRAFLTCLAAPGATPTGCSPSRPAAARSDLGPVRAVRADCSCCARDHEATEPQLLHALRARSRRGSAAGFVRDLEADGPRLSDNDVARTPCGRQPRRRPSLRALEVHRRTGTLMVRQFEETRRAHLLVALSTRLEDYADDEEFELAVSVVGSPRCADDRDGHTLSAMTSSASTCAPTTRRCCSTSSGVGYDLAHPACRRPCAGWASRRAGASVADGGLRLRHRVRRLRAAVASSAPTCASSRCPGARGIDLALRSMGDLDLAGRSAGSTTRRLPCRLAT